MTVTERINFIRLLNKVNDYKSYYENIGIHDVSIIRNLQKGYGDLHEKKT